jgi:hypothetical protein
MVNMPTLRPSTERRLKFKYNCQAESYDSAGQIMAWSERGSEKRAVET